MLIIVKRHRYYFLLRRTYLLYNIDIGIDLGTANVLVYVRDRGIVINQPAVVAYEVSSKNIIAVGSKAKRMLGKTPEDIEVVRPIKHGVISDYTLTERMLKAFVKNAMQKRKFWGRPTICVCVPSGITEVERRAVEDAVYRTGARQVFILEEPMASAIGAGVDIMETYGHMVVDIGAGTTDIAVISAGGVAEGRSVKVAGDDFNDALIRYLRRRHSLHVGELTAESTKMEIGSVYTREEDDEMEVKGKNLINGLPIKVRVTANETVEAFKEVSEQIVDAVYNVLEDAPPELVADIAKTGILLTGGGSLIYGMDKLIEEKTGIKVFVSENALETVAIGAGNAGEYIVMKQEENREQD